MPETKAKASIPPFLKRRMITMIAGSIGVGLLAPLVSYFAEGEIPNWAYLIGVVSIPGIVSGFIGSTWGIAVERTQKRAKAIGGRMCWNCGYSLEGLAAAGTCPECGHDFELSDLRRRWWAPKDPPELSSHGNVGMPSDPAA